MDKINKQAWLSEIWRRLDQIERDLMGSSRPPSTELESVSQASSSSDTIDRSDAIQSVDLSLSLANMNFLNLRQVQVAKWRLASGEYGLCVDCREEIEEKRLRAIPFAIRCLKCAETHDTSKPKTGAGVARGKLAPGPMKKITYLGNQG